MIDGSIYDSEGLLSSEDTVVVDDENDGGYTLDDAVVESAIENEEIHGEDPESESVSNNGSSEDLIISFLKDRGIEDPSKLKFQTDDGSFEDVDFNSLTDKEKLNVLRDLADEIDLSQEEIDVINLMRSNDASFKDILEHYAKYRVDDFVSRLNQEKYYEIDDYSDDELFVADLKIKYPNFSDEELINKLETEKLNEELYNKQVTALREYYKQQEDLESRQIEAQQQEDIAAFKNYVGETLDNFNQVAIDPLNENSDLLTIEQSDKQAIYDYLFTQDSSGMSQLAKDLNDPAMLVQLGWFMTQGNNIMNDLASYWKDTLKEERRQSNKLRKELESYKKNISQTTVLSTESKKPKAPNRVGERQTSNLNQLWAELYN